MKKFISLLVTIALVCLTSVMLTGCNESGNYPVTISNIVIESEPENIVVLDAYTADIIEFEGYDVKMVGRSDDVFQSDLSAAPSVGSSSDPDIDTIIKQDADIVFAGINLSDESKSKLKESGITVITISPAANEEQIETNYKTIGKILGGMNDGAENGEKSYAELIDELETIKSSAENEMTSDVCPTVCYIYSEDGQLKMMTSGTYGNTLLGYTSAMNVAVNIEEESVDVEILKRANPNYVFYDSDETLELIKSDDTLKTLSAVKDGKTLKITEDEFSLQGTTAVATVQKMAEFIYPQLASDESVDATAAESTQQSTQASTDAASSSSSAAETTTAAETTVAPTTEAAAKSVAEDYKIDTDGLSLKQKDNNSNVKAVQQRLYDLGYVTDKDNITGYYGSVTADAIKKFQKNNEIKETGTADNDTIKALFTDNAVKAN